MDLDEFDVQWRLKAIELAQREQIDLDGEINLGKLFSRGKVIYNEGYQNRIDDWKNIWKETPKKGKINKPLLETLESENVPVETIEDDPEGKKMCPVCREYIPKGWAKHGYKADGSPCGHEF